MSVVGVSSGFSIMAGSAKELCSRKWKKKTAWVKPWICWLVQFLLNDLVNKADAVFQKLHVYGLLGI